MDGRKGGEGEGERCGGFLGRLQVDFSARGVTRDTVRCVRPCVCLHVWMCVCMHLMTQALLLGVVSMNDRILLFTIYFVALPKY